MADEILFEGGDTLTEDDIGQALARTGYSNYVAADITVTADYQAAVCDISSGRAYLIHNGRDRTLLPDARAGVPLATDGINHLYITITEASQPSGGSKLAIEYAASSDGTPPTSASASLKVAEIDMGARTVTEVNRFEPGSDNDAQTYKGSDIDTDGDGVVDAADSAATVKGNDIDTDGDGVVDEAELAQAIANFDKSDYLRNDQDGTLAGALTWQNPEAAFITLEDGSGGSNPNKHTIRFNDRGLRFVSGVGDGSGGIVGTALEIEGGGNVNALHSLRMQGSEVYTKDTIGSASVGNAANADAIGSNGAVPLRSNLQGNNNQISNIRALDIRADASPNNGMDLWAAPSDAEGFVARITPYKGSTRATDSELGYAFGSDFWFFESPVEFQANYVMLPKASGRASDAPVGSIVYREDHD